jgi:hypothetical protein
MAINKEKRKLREEIKFIVVYIKKGSIWGVYDIKNNYFFVKTLYFYSFNGAQLKSFKGHKELFRPIWLQVNNKIKIKYSSEIEDESIREAIVEDIYYKYIKNLEISKLFCKIKILFSKSFLLVEYDLDELAKLVLEISE